MCASRRRARGTCRPGRSACRSEIQQAIREACPGVIINHTTGTSGPNYQGALECVRETKPEIAACNAGSLNYLKVKADNSWAWPPMMFDNAVEKVQDYLDVMKDAGTIPEFECFDVGIVRCVGMYRQTGMYPGPLEYNFVMGVASGMPADPELLPILLELKAPEAPGRSPRSAAPKSGRCTSAAPNSAVICAPDSRTRSISPTAPR